MPTPTETIIDAAVKPLEDRFAEIKDQKVERTAALAVAIDALKQKNADELRPLLAEEKEAAEAIQRMTGSYPSGYSGSAKTRAPRSSGTRERMTKAETEALDASIVKVLEAEPKIGRSTIAERLNLDPAKLSTRLTAMKKAGVIDSEGSRRDATWYARR